MQEITITTSHPAHRYRISVGGGLLRQVESLLGLSAYSKVFVLTDQQVEGLWLRRLRPYLPDDFAYLALPPGERIKDIAHIQRIWTAMREAGCDRKSLLVILGGGVMGDMGGFAASTFMRGMAFAQIPTTLLSQVDSSMGGKTGFDFDGLKNFIGTFAQPTAVIIDTDTLATLPKRELTAGFAEMLKHGLIADAGYFDALADRRPSEYSPASMADLIARSTRIKAAIVERDEKESGDRKLLNFGHTVGHAIEALSWERNRPLLHGEAVAMGMVVEAHLSQCCGLLAGEDVARITQVVAAAGLPTTVPAFPLSDMWAKMRNDKKNESGVVLFTLLERIGKAVYNQSVDEAAVTEIVRQNMEGAHAT